MVNWESKKLGDYLMLGNWLLLIVLLFLISSAYFFRIDLTEEKRFSIKPQTQQLLLQLEDVVYVEVFLEGDLNAGFKRLRNSIEEILEVFRSYSGNKVRFVFTNPITALGQNAQSEFVQELVSKGIQMLPVIETKDGERVEKIVFPGALVSYGGFETGVMLFNGNRAQNSQEVLNQSIEGLEYQLANAIYNLTNPSRKRLVFLSGHGELDSLATASLRSALSDQYDIFEKDLSAASKLEDFDLVILGKPTRPFSERDKFQIDQYLMNGGPLLIFLDRMDARMDSASSENYFAFPYETGLDDQLFKYGIRINADLIQDRLAAQYPVITGKVGDQSQMMKMDWPFFPLINQYADHAITRNMDVSITRFVSSMDTVKAGELKKTPLLFSSPYSRKLGAPVKISVNDLRKSIQSDQFNEGPIPVAYLLEGSFHSLYTNRFLPDSSSQDHFKNTSLPTKMIVVADGDFIRNDINTRTGQPQQLGLDPMSGYTFANQGLVLNMIAYLTDEEGLILARNKELKVRPLDKQQIKNERVYWQFINLVLPVLFIIMFGVLRTTMRRRTYSRFV